MSLARRAFLPLLPAALAAACASEPPARTYLVFFAPFMAEPDADARTILDRAAAGARAFPNEPIQVIGFADPEGTTEENRRLSQARADSVAKALGERGVAPGRILRGARGATDPQFAMVESRRVEIRIGAEAGGGGTPQPYRS
jgi:outer membrane protein OmpA-like peptidoglycan-associated protein